MAELPDLFIDRAIVAKVPARRVRWKATYRLVPARYPPIRAFERIADPEDWQLLEELESLTDRSVREEVGEIRLVPPSRRVSGPGASVVMAPFTHASKARPTRFSDGSYGVYYAGHKFETALREVAYHMGNFYGGTEDKPHDEVFRAWEGAVDSVMHDLRKGDWSLFLDPDPGNYRHPQEVAHHLRESGSNGIVYPSVRHRKGECVAAFWPDVVALPTEMRRIALKWDGKKIASWFDYETEEWKGL